MGLEIAGAGGQGVTGSGTVDQIPIWTGTSQLGNSVLRQVGVAIVVGATDPAPAAAETLRTIGGVISDTGAGHDNLRTGRAAAAAAVANARNVVLGTEAAADAATSGIASGAVENVVIGFQARMRHGVGSCVIVGSNNTMGGSTPQPTTVVGSGNLFDNAFSGPGIGIGSTWNGAGAGFGNQQSIAVVNNWVAVGRAARVDATGATAIGDAARAAHVHAIAIGRNALTLAANQLVIGALNVGISSVLIGEGDTVAAYGGITYRHTDGSGTDDPGGDVTVVACRGTGAAGATGGRLVYQTGTQAASGAALQAAAARLEIWPSLAGAQGACVNFANVTDGALGTVAAAAGSAGDPVAWLPIRFNGVVRFIPVW